MPHDHHLNEWTERSYMRSITVHMHMYIMLYVGIQRRRLVINIGGGQKFGSQILGGKNLGKINFQTTF